jgi:hypothetical protein
MICMFSVVPFARGPIEEDRTCMKIYCSHPLGSVDCEIVRCLLLSSIAPLLYEGESSARTLC